MLAKDGRFVDRSWQLVGDQERAHYLARLSQALARSDWVLIGYALMSSHVHLLFVAGADPLGSWTESVQVRMARWLNTRQGRLGPVFADRPYAEAIDDGRTTTTRFALGSSARRRRARGPATARIWDSSLQAAVCRLRPAFSAAGFAMMTKAATRSTDG